MRRTEVTDTIKYVGVNDRESAIFESQYIIPEGITYNSYIIEDEKIAVMDAVDLCKKEEWFANVEATLGDKTPDYFVCLHMEPDHAGSAKEFIEKYPEMQVVGNVKTFTMMEQFFSIDLEDRKVVVKEGSELSLGYHKLHFVMAPMVHWPEVMVAYESTEKVLFSADAFGTFGTMDVEDEDWSCEARRYYFNIVGKYGAQVQALLKKAAGLDIQIICSLHGPVLAENLGFYIDKYRVWSSYEPEDKGIFIAYASIHGNTKYAAEEFKKLLESKSDVEVAITDLTRDDMAEAVEDAFRYDRMVLMAASYDGGVFPCMEDFLHHLKAKNYQKRTIGLIENGSWAPSAIRSMKGIIEGMKNITLCDTTVTIKSTLKEDSITAMEQLADELIAL